MLTLNRNRQSLIQPALLCVVVGSLCWVTSSTATGAVAAQGDDQSPAESSILIRDDQPGQPNFAQPAQPSFTARAQEQSPDQSRPSQPNFEIPANPTRRDFTNPSTEGFERSTKGFERSTEGFERSPANDRSDPNATLAQETRESHDPFDTPRPPLGSDRLSGSASTAVRVAEPGEFKPQTNQRSPLSQNDLRGGANKLAPQVNRSSFSLSDRPKTDAATAAPRFVDTRPAPPASLPSSTIDRPSDRFNPQFFAQQNTEPQPRQLPTQPRSRSIDDQVAATSYSQPVASAPVASEPASPSKLAKMIVDRYSMDNAPDPLPGEPISLVEMLQQPLPPQNRRQMISQYWETWFDWASTQNAIACQEWLKTVPTAGNGDQGLLDAARSAADNEVLAAEIQLGKSQSKLIRFMPTRGSDLAPLPSDSPLVERYETHYDLYKSRNMLPASLQGIDQMLPRTLELIESRAQTVQKAQAAIKQTLTAYKNRQAPLASVLEAARVWRSSEEDLLASVTNYNQAIADYALNVTKRYTTPEQTVAMLIGTPKVKTESLPTAARTARQPNFGNNQDRFGQNTSNRTTTGTNFGQTGRAPRQTPTGRPAVSDFGRSTQRRTLQSNASSSRDQGNSFGTRRPPQQTASTSTRPQADSRPSLNTNSRGSTGSEASNTMPASPVGFGGRSREPAANSATTANSSRSSSGRAGQSNTNNNMFGGNASETPTAKPARKPFPLPKRPKPNSNSFRGFGK